MDALGVHFINCLNKEVKMTFNKLPSIFKQLRPVSIGFDNIFDHFENFFDDDQSFHTSLTSTFPFYNIVKKGNNKFDIEVALAGYDKKDIMVEYEDNLLHIKSVKETKSDKEKDGVIHQGIAKRYFSKAFTIADDVEIEGAELKNGLLKVSLKQIVPEGKKPKQITVK
jgi:molecular chaperone IbpA